MSKNIVIYSWNVAGSLEKPAAFLKKANPDIIFLLEAGPEDGLKTFAGDKTYRYSKGSYPLAIVSKLAIEDYEQLNLPHLSKPVLMSTYKIQNHSFTVFALHLKNDKGSPEQVREAKTILEEVEKRTKNTSTIILGDFNALTRADGEKENTAIIELFLSRGYVDAFKCKNPDRTEPTKIDRSNKNKRIDYILVSKDLVPFLTKSYVLSETDKDISDHRAVWASFDFQAEKIGNVAFRIGGGETADKPQSKCWYHDGSWWCILADGTGTFFHEFTNGNWIKKQLVDPSTSGRADVLCDDAQLYVVIYMGNPSEQSLFFKYHYDKQTKEYLPDAGFPIPISVPPGHETMVIEKDSTGRIWLTYKAQGNIWASCSEPGNERLWTFPGGVIQPDVSNDDISSIVSFQGKIGVFWSDQKRHQFGFKIHKDDDPADKWQPVEVVDDEEYIADDHINIASAKDGRIFVVTKTSKNDVKQNIKDPLLVLYVRSREGKWTHHTVLTVEKKGTRPIVLADEVNDKLYILYTDNEAGGRILYKSTSLNSMDFHEEAKEFISVPGVKLNNVTSTKQNIDSTTGLMAICKGGHIGYFNFIR
ncbi:MAG: endonuclease/exonuclease/phosphatase family protein [Verrucomicrobia bacterium]|nr:endonuclease/exonuclease/phosphatase family protein [Verrucomicrobiota bacterium]MBU4292164.1 endonuclease/exonuclease/phosphatase family protein [Verrucomicrobiota bacterium]MBU4429438.1 endonuclease/exonuclease/phosphatase family protein [Verrucomicrobiota bacterium]MCG2681609.1 endonuclease/exonuclease/phosphatase family protein [Kiritimatiellia bacterium]